MNILIAGNDEKVSLFYHYFKDKFPEAHIAILLETQKNINLTTQSTDFNSFDNIPTIYGDIEKIDFDKKNIYFYNSGVIKFDIFISLSILVSEVEVKEQCKNVYYCYNYLQKIPEKIFSDQGLQHILLVCDDKKTDTELTPALNQKCFKLKASQISKFHYFEDIITSVTTTEKKLLLVDFVLLSAAKYKVPSYLCNSMLTFEQMELYHVYHFNFTDYKKMDSISKKLEKTDKYFCILKMKLLPECEILEDHNKFLHCYAYDACLMENSSHTSLLTYINQKVTEPFDSNGASGLDSYYTSISSWLKAARDATYWRMCDLQQTLELLKIPEVLLMMGAKGFFPYDSSIKSSLEWILACNYQILQFKIKQKSMEQRIFSQGIGNAVDKGPFILYFGSRRQHHDRIIKSYKRSDCPINILTMGCGGLSLSMSTAWPHLAGYLEQEYLVNLPECVGIILDQACLRYNTNNLIKKSSVPVIDTSIIPLLSQEDEWDKFFIKCSKQTKLKSTISTKLNTANILIDACNEFDFTSRDKWLVLPACSGDWKQAPFIEDIRQYIQQDFSIYSLGCSLSVLTKAGHYPEYLPHTIQRKFYGSGSYENIITAAKALSAKTKIVFLSGPLKIDAWIDALILNKYFQFEIKSNNDFYLNFLKNIKQYF